jgi:hypothetical protein
MPAELPKSKELAQQVFRIQNEKDFLQIALRIFNYQFQNNLVYGQYCKAIRKSPDNVFQLTEIPFLPIRFFKTHPVITGKFEKQTVFKSSGTTGAAVSKHFVNDISLYEKSFLTCFEQFYGPVQRQCILGFLPSYLEQGSSSLVYMVDYLVKRSGHSLSGFYLYDHRKLYDTLLQLETAKQRTILFGVSYALLDLAESFSTPLQFTTIIETGGMKGRKKEIIKEELYRQLQQAFSVEQIHSEYGMTELLSQAYAMNGIYKTPPWMKVLLRDETDPFSFISTAGAINVVDLANIHSCSFIATDDRGRLHPDGSFEVLGRLDNSDIRGCSQLVL